MSTPMTIRKAWRILVPNALLSAACLVYYFIGSPGAALRGAIITYFIGTCGTAFMFQFHPKLKDEAFHRKLKLLLLALVGWFCVLVLLTFIILE